MAIYDYNSISEQEIAKDTDTILDSMLEACETMMSTLNESKARRRYLQVQADKQDNEDKKAELYRDIAKNGPASKKGEYLAKSMDAKAKSNNIGNNNIEYTAQNNDKFGDSKNSGNLRKEIDNEKYYSKTYLSSRDGATIAEKNFKKDFNTKNDYQAPKAGKYLEWQKKKRAIKETCLNILAAIDDI